jgi:hypothetical protein
MNGVLKGLVVHEFYPPVILEEFNMLTWLVKAVD